MLARHGATVVDSDTLARQAVELGTPTLTAIAHRFGDGVLLPTGELNRAALGRLVFRDPVARRDLNAIVHPEVGRLREVELERARLARVRIVVSDVPLLFEVRLEDSFDAVVLVDAPEPMRLQRLITRRDLPEADARAMMSAQWAAHEKRALATYIIDNDGTVEQLQQRVDALWQELEALAITR